MKHLYKVMQEVLIRMTHACSQIWRGMKRAYPVVTHTHYM